MTIPYPYAPIDSFESLHDGTFVWHPSQGDGMVSKRTPTHLYVIFYWTATVSEIDREEAVEQMGYIR